MVVFDTILFASGFAYWATSVHLDVWLRELSRTGLPAPAQQELLRRLAWAIDRRTRYFSGPPLAFVERMKEILLSAFLPQTDVCYIYLRRPPQSAWESKARRFDVCVWGRVALFIFLADSAVSRLTSFYCLRLRPIAPLRVFGYWGDAVFLGLMTVGVYGGDHFSFQSPPQCKFSALLFLGRFREVAWVFFCFPALERGERSFFTFVSIAVCA